MSNESLVIDSMIKVARIIQASSKQILRKGSLGFFLNSRTYPYRTIAVQWRWKEFR